MTYSIPFLLFQFLIVLQVFLALDERTTPTMSGKKSNSRKIRGGSGKERSGSRFHVPSIMTGDEDLNTPPTPKTPLSPSKSSPSLSQLTQQLDLDALTLPAPSEQQQPVVLVKRGPLPPSALEKELSGGTGNARKAHSAGRVKLHPQYHMPPVQSKNIFRSFHAEYALDLDEPVGVGGYAVVRRATHKATQKVYAVKVMTIVPTVEEEESSSDDDDDDEDAGLDLDEDEEGELDMSMTIAEVMNEIDLVARLDHPNIIKYHEYFINAPDQGLSKGKQGAVGSNGGVGSGSTATAATMEPNKPAMCYIVMDLMEGETLVDELHKRATQGRYGEDDAKVLMGCLLDAVHFMHINNVIHRDIKLENLMLARPGDISSVTVIDFGLAKAARARERMEDFCGTLWYYAPELVRGIPFGPTVDEWALGVCMHMLVTGNFPWDHEDSDELEGMIKEAKLDLDDEQYAQISPQAKDLMRHLLEPKARKRLTAHEALEHPWFTGGVATAEVLWHVHERLDTLMTQTRLPTRVFRQGEVLFADEQSSTGGVVYMIKRGVCEITDRHTRRRLCTRRKGNFVAKDSASFSEKLVSPRSAPTTPRRSTSNNSNNSSSSNNNNNNSGSGEQAVFTNLKQQQQQEEEDEEEVYNRDPSVRPSLLSSSSSSSSSSDMMAKEWVVTAVTEVEVTVLEAELMQWAVDHDYRLEGELKRAMIARRKVLSVLAKEESKRSADPKLASPRIGGLASSLVQKIAGMSTDDKIRRFKVGLGPILDEYMASEDVGEVAACLSELDAVCGFGKTYLIIKKAVSLALDRGDREKELVAKLLSVLCPGLVDPPSMELGYHHLLESAHELKLDVPDASSQIARFLARAIVDGLIDAAFLDKQEGMGEDFMEVLDSTKKILHRRMNVNRLRRAWGEGSAGSVTYCKQKIASLLEEFTVAHDYVEAIRCLHELRAPFFHHEFVKRLAMKAATSTVGSDVTDKLLGCLHNSQEGSPEWAKMARGLDEVEALLLLLAVCVDSGVLTVNQLTSGWEKAGSYMSEYELDVPGASKRFEQIQSLVDQCHSTALSLISEVPPHLQHHR